MVIFLQLISVFLASLLLLVIDKERGVNGPPRRFMFSEQERKDGVSCLSYVVPGATRRSVGFQEKTKYPMGFVYPVTGN